MKGFRLPSTGATGSGSPRSASRSILVAGLALTGALWSVMALAHPNHGGAAHGPGAVFSFPAFGTTALLWLVMMAAMMTPAALPWLVVLAGEPAGGAAPERSGIRLVGEPFRHAGAFLAGYLAVWGLFSVAAAASQLLLLELAALQTSALRLEGRAAGGVLLLAGLYELSPFKQACLRHCRSPFGLYLSSWSGGGADNAGSRFRLGARHGLICLACCWALMALAFIVGVVSLGWMALLTGVVCAQKLLPGGHRLPRILGAALLAWGGAMLL